MFLKKKKQDLVDSTLIKKQIMEWATTHNIKIHLFEVILGDYRDVGTENRIDVIIYFKTNKNLKEYTDHGYLSEFKKEVTNMVNNPKKEIVFEFDTDENVQLKCNGNYIKYRNMKYSEK